MMPAAPLILFLLAASPSLDVGAPTPHWEKVFEGQGEDGWLSSVWAAGRDDWFVAGGWGVTRSSKAGLERKETPGRPVLGLHADSANSVFALGAGELVLRYDGQRWTEEHIGPVPKPRRPRSGGHDMLHFAYDIDSSGLAAVGPWLVLVRQPSGSWTQPSEAERYRLFQLGQAGPEHFARPSKCAPGPWRWLRKDFAWFACQDRRSFVYDAGKVTPMGKMPKACDGALTSVGSASGEIIAVCDQTLWKADGATWRALPAPDDKDSVRSKDFGGISIADGCIFVAAHHALWRRCEK